MASAGRRICVGHTIEEMKELCPRGDDKANNDVDSERGAFLIGEEFELDRQLNDTSDSEIGHAR